MFCFRCGLVAHNDNLCSNTPPQAPHSAEGCTNPRGAWLRSKVYGRRLLDKKKAFSSNPLKSLSGGQFSPIPKGLMDKMARLNLNRQKREATTSSTSPGHSPRPAQQAFQYKAASSITIMKTEGNNQQLIFGEVNNSKRKQDSVQENTNNQGEQCNTSSDMASLTYKASQTP